MEPTVSSDAEDKVTPIYDVALSFAGEQRPYVEAVAAALAAHQIRVFYDQYEAVALWGKDLYTHLDSVYRLQARYSILFLSEAYAKKVWTNHERESAQARVLEEHGEYVLPVRFDNTTIPGLRPTIGYLSADDYSPEELAEMVTMKIGGPVARPRLPDSMFAYLDRDATEIAECEWRIEANRETREFDDDGDGSGDDDVDGRMFTPADDAEHRVARSFALSRR